MKRTKAVVLIFGCLLVTATSALGAGPASAPPPPESVATLEQVIAREGYSSERLLALGRAQLRAGQPGAAAASFEQGLLLSPRDEALQRELSRVRTEAGVQQPEPKSAERILSLLSLREWAHLTLGALLLLSCTILARALLSRWHRALNIALSVGLAVTVAGALGVATVEQKLERAVSLEDGAIGRQSPFASADALFTLRAGEPVRMLERHGEYTYVARTSGGAGWVATTSLRPLAAKALPQA